MFYKPEPMKSSYLYNENDPFWVLCDCEKYVNEDVHIYSYIYQSIYDTYNSHTNTHAQEHTQALAHTHTNQR